MNGQTASPRLTAPWTVIASIASVVAVTAIVGALARAVPPISLGVLYLFAILPVAARFGLVYATAVSFASMLAYNFFVLPPVHTFRLAESANWLALAVYLATSAVVSELAARDRRRAEQAERREREATLLAEIATGLLSRGASEAEVDHIAVGAAAAVGARRGRIAFGSHVVEVPTGSAAYPLRSANGHVGTLVTDEGSEPDAMIVERFLPAVASLLAVAIDRDRLVNEAAEAEVLRQSDLIKTTILRAVSHDLRSPLTAIRVAGEALRDGTLTLDALDRRELTDTILAASERLDRVVGNLLDLSRLQAGAAEPQPELLTTDGLVADALRELGDEADRVHVDLAPELPLVHVDRGQIGRVLANLLENALRYSPPGKPVVVQIGRTANEVQIAVIDHGPGLEAGDGSRLFEPFARGRHATGGGAGLGLAIARGFAVANGGSVAVEESAVGATFVLTLPAGGEEP